MIRNESVSSSSSFSLVEEDEIRMFGNTNGNQGNGGEVKDKSGAVGIIGSGNGNGNGNGNFVNFWESIDGFNNNNN